MIPIANDKIAEVGVNIAEKATMIWNVADMLRGRLNPMTALAEVIYREMRKQN